MVEKRYKDISDWYYREQLIDEMFQKRNLKCEHCGTKENLTIHHKKEFALFPKLRFEVSNCIYLCENCHKKVHNKSKPKVYKYNSI
jgi:5-methylcytosine-specific restriction endonuclease McrA